MLASTRLIKGRLNKAMPADSLQWALHGVKINGVAHGCSGFVRNKENGVVVYINTDMIIMQGNKTILIRYAKDFTDYTGCRNMYTNEDKFVDDIKQMLLNLDAYMRELSACHKI